MEIGLTTFVETTPDVKTGKTISHAERIREVIEEIVLADEVGLDVYGVGEHHRKDYACSAPAVLLAAAASRTKNIRLSSAVTVLSSDDPVRVFQEFSTVDAISNGRAEIMAGRGSFIESFPLFGYDLKDYDELYEEKLELLLQLTKNEIINWKGKHRADISNRGVYPRPVQETLPVWIASGGTPQSVARAGYLGLPLALAIIGGSPLQFAPLVNLYYRAAKEAGHDPSKLTVASHSHGFLADTTEEAIEKFFPPTQQAMNVLGRERGWGQYTRESFDHARSIEGALYTGDVNTVAEKIILLRKKVGITRFMLHCPVGSMPHADVMKSIELLGKEVAPIVREEIQRWEAAGKPQ
ncbi:LLM class flavin-dependent oxidoreductase [Ureibacillus chungkukjangi]|uniref:Putative LLM family oxidoreductase n=1 Tax=Ureibacillus chungkukjangi TaxID=1202712 RepID=A0A318TMA5_9BACL|nr:LLM class flavin-dependent oxidoreductase [Ureibacillus chungkukjangi]MCM3388570.1 LLM class flavin-dependent oxidoreductase [Ureibacillus chungkukjangi]PYF05886.1 putative LLM family oxidoreductase [Ureibacillus chungkukjangi]